MESYEYQTITNIEKFIGQSSLNETYFGDSSLRQIQNQFSKFRAKWIDKDFDQRVNYDPDLLKFNRMMEEKFGLFRFCLTVTGSYNIDASMIDVSCFADTGAIDRYSSNLKVYKSGDGFRYDKSAHVSGILNIYYGLIYRKEYTDREVIAVILHEVGHSFFDAIMHKMPVGYKSAAITNIARNVMDLVKNNTDRDISDQKTESDFAKNNITSIAKYAFQKSADTSKRIFHAISDTISGMKRNLKQSDYTNEKFADTFASMYGYGTDLTSALDKMEESIVSYYMADKKAPGPIITAIKVALLSFGNIVAFIFNCKDPHPEGITRVVTQIAYLERELRNMAIDPLMKIELQNQLSAQKQLVQDYLDRVSEPNGYQVMRKYYAKLYEKYGGDIRETVTDNNALFEYIENKYNRLLKKEAAIEDDDDIEDEDREPVNELIDSDSLDESTQFSIAAVFGLTCGDTTFHNESSTDEPVNELFGIGKKKNMEYHHLNKQELSAVISSCKKHIGKYAKLKKCVSFVSMYDSMSDYYSEDGNSEFIVANVDIWDGWEHARSEESYEEYNSQVNDFLKDVNDDLQSKNILAKVTISGDWDTFDIVAVSKKV